MLITRRTTQKRNYFGLWGNNAQTISRKGVIFQGFSFSAEVSGNAKEGKHVDFFSLPLPTTFMLKKKKKLSITRTKEKNYI